MGRQLAAQLRGLRAAVELLTIVPLGRGATEAADLGRAVVYFPVVGLLVGWLLAWLAWASSRIWNAWVGAAIVVSAWVVSTGALHVDGLLDSCDGLFGGRTVEERLRILRDEHVGAYAVVGAVLWVLLITHTLAALAEPTGPLLLAPVVGRWSMVLAITLFPYARPEGLGRVFKDQAGPWGLLATSIFTVGAGWLILGFDGLVCVALGGGVTLLAGLLVPRRLPGWTGDLYGALCVLVETMVLLFLAARQKP